jgi:hypothetical protein
LNLRAFPYTIVLKHSGDGSAKSETTMGVVITGNEHQLGGSGRWGKSRPVPRAMASSMPVHMLGGIKMVRAVGWKNTACF